MDDNKKPQLSQGNQVNANQNSNTMLSPMLQKLSMEDYQELKASGISDGFINLSGAQTITVKEAKERGFKAYMDSRYIRSCLYLPFYDRHGKEIIDEVTQMPVGVIKPRFKEDTNKELLTVKNKKIPKYICFDKEVQSRQYIHHPKGFNWDKYYNDYQEKNRIIYLTEGWKKAESACSLDIPTICVWSTYCFNESGMGSPLIPELVSAIVDFKKLPVIVFDSDKSFKDSVMKAEYSLLDKILKKTKVVSQVIDLPQQVNDQVTKGFDDFLVVAGLEGFSKLEIKPAHTPFIFSRKQYKVPEIPRRYLPDLYRVYVDEIDLNYEGCLEIAPQALLCQGAVALGNRFKLEGKKANIYAFGIAQQSSGKSSVARECLKPIFEINQEYIKEYYDNLKSSKDLDTNNISKQILVQDFTEEGLIDLLGDQLKEPRLLFFETEEFDHFLEKFNRDYNSALSRFITKAFDTPYLTTSTTKSNLSKQLKPSLISDPAISFSGVGTEVGILNSLPKNATKTGFDARFIRFIGKPRLNKCIVKPKPVTEALKENMKRVIKLILNLEPKIGDFFDFTLSKEAYDLYEKAYRLHKDWEEKHSNDLLIPYYRRALTDYSWKLALQFEVISRAEKIVLNAEIEDHELLFRESIENDLTISIESMLWALEWAQYFMETAKYFHEKYLSNDHLFDDKLDKAIVILEEYPQGVSASQLRTKLNLHRNKSQKELFWEIINYLKEYNEIVVKQGSRKSQITISLKKHVK